MLNVDQKVTKFKAATKAQKRNVPKAIIKMDKQKQKKHQKTERKVV